MKSSLHDNKYCHPEDKINVSIQVKTLLAKDLSRDQSWLFGAYCNLIW